MPTSTQRQKKIDMGCLYGNCSKVTDDMDKGWIFSSVWYMQIKLAEKE